jgi:hypothetical protein
VGAGAFAGSGLHRSRVEGLLEEGASWCSSPTVFGFSDEAACTEAAQRCIREGWALPGARIARAGALRTALEARLTRLRASGEDQGLELGRIERLARELRDSAESPKRAQAVQAGLVCVAESGGAPF